MVERNSNGTFAIGNPGGPGRPRRTVEREYLAAMLDAVGGASRHALGAVSLSLHR